MTGARNARRGRRVGTGVKPHRRDRPLPDEVLPWDPEDKAAQARRDRRWAKRAAGSSLALMALLNVFTQIFHPSAKRVVFEQHQPGSADPLTRDPDAGRFAGRMALPTDE